MPNSWANGAPSHKGGAGKSAGQKGTSTGKMRYVPPPTRAQASSTAPPAGKGKMKYVPPPKDAGVWARPQTKSSEPSKWDELAAKEESKLKASKVFPSGNRAVGMSGNDKADMAATRADYDFWTKQDVTRTLAWSRAEECRIPNKRVAKGGRLHKLINILLNNCDFVNDRLAREKRFNDAVRDPTMPGGLELKRLFVAPLARRVLNKVEEQEIEKAYRDDDPDSDDSDSMAI